MNSAEALKKSIKVCMFDNMALWSICGRPPSPHRSKPGLDQIPVICDLVYPFENWMIGVRQARPIAKSVSEL